MADNLKVEWTGAFEQFGLSRPMDFKNMYMDLNGNVFGVGADQVGDFQLSGIWRNTHIEFIKTYFASHVIFYTAKTEDGKRFEGSWRIPDSCEGTFWIEIKIPSWSGKFTESKKQEKFSFDMQVSPQGVFGLGQDKEGFYVIKGTHDEKFSCVNFVKSYLGGSNRICYNGAMVMAKAGRKVKGVWCVKDTTNFGYFELNEG
jgi:hypothetical protein